MTFTWIGIGAVALVGVSWLAAFNRFVRQRNLIRDSWSNVDTELRRRYDLIPNLVETVKGYAAHENEVLLKVTEARAAAVASTGRAEQQAHSEEALVSALDRLFGVVENYPELQASKHFLELQHELVNTEDRIQAARRIYNANVRDYNQRVQSFPTMVVARVGNFHDEQFFEVHEAIRASMRVVW